jgi:hypothetical protein
VRRLVTVITILPLATAAAAGAGDDIKWESASEIPYVDLAGDGSTAPPAYDEEVERYSAAWLPAVGTPEIDFIEATYYGWRLHCSRLKAAVADGKLSESAFFYEVERSKDVFRNFVIFYVTISALAQPDTNLANPRRWTIYLERGEEKFAPASIKIDQNAPTHIFIIKKYGKRVGVKNWYRKTYKIAFANRGGGPPSENLRLVITGEKARRGFEWRFKED